MDIGDKTTVFDIPTKATFSLAQACKLINNTPGALGDQRYRWGYLFDLGMETDELIIGEIGVSHKSVSDWRATGGAAKNTIVATVKFCDAEDRLYSTATFQFRVDETVANQIFSELMSRHRGPDDDADEEVED